MTGIFSTVMKIYDVRNQNMPDFHHKFWFCSLRINHSSVEATQYIKFSNVGLDVRPSFGDYSTLFGANQIQDNLGSLTLNVLIEIPFNLLTQP